MTIQISVRNGDIRQEKSLCIFFIDSIVNFAVSIPFTRFTKGLHSVESSWATNITGVLLKRHDFDNSTTAGVEQDKSGLKSEKKYATYVRKFRISDLMRSKWLPKGVSVEEQKVIVRSGHVKTQLSFEQVKFMISEKSTYDT